MSTLLYDCTLRDGTQGEGVNLSVDDKLKIARKLDAFGMHFIEGGWPGSNPKDAEFFERAAHMEWKHARITAFGSTRRANTAVDKDPQLQMLLDARTPVVTMVAKTSPLHVTHVLETDLEENLDMIAESVAYMKQHGREVVHDAEHYFDGYKLDRDYAIATLRAARDAGADWLVLCDTNGGSMPWEVEEIVRDTIRELRIENGESRKPSRMLNSQLSILNSDFRFGIHTHNDAGTGVANALAAVRAGCEMVQATINGIGERVGNCDIVATIANLKIKLGDDCVSDENLRGLTELSRFVFEVANLSPDIRQPYVGQSAFAHKGGIHVNAVMKLESSYQHIDPTLVGNLKRVLVSELSGRGNIAYKAKEFGLNPEGAEVKQVLAQVKDMESRGFFFENADATLELMLRRTMPNHASLFELIDYMVVVEHRAGRGMVSEASVKMRVDGELAHTVADGDGPVGALDNAMRKALLPHYPKLKKVRLIDFKVRIIDGIKASAATTRVTIDSTDGRRTWTTVGCSANIVEASWQALSDSVEFALLIA